MVLPIFCFGVSIFPECGILQLGPYCCTFCFGAQMQSCYTWKWGRILQASRWCDPFSELGL